MLHPDPIPQAYQNYFLLILATAPPPNTESIKREATQVEKVYGIANTGNKTLSDHTKANGAHINNAIRSAAATIINRSFIYYIL